MITSFLDASGRPIQVGDHVRDIGYHHNIEGLVTRTYFEGGKIGGRPLLAVKFGGTTVTRYPQGVKRLRHLEGSE